MTEIFIEPELQDLELAENSAEWFEIASSLNLDQQLQHADRSEEKKAPTYMHADPKTLRIMKTLCPVEVVYSKYSVSTIPLDVLKEIKKCEENGWYAQIKILYDDKSPDPFVIGFTHAESNWDRAVHVIARWGNELLPWEALEVKAIARIKMEAKDALLDVKHKIDTALSDIEHFATQLLNGREVPKYEHSVESVSRWI